MTCRATETGATLRPAVTEDVDALARLHVAVWRATYAAYAPAKAVAALDEAKRLPYWQGAVGGDAPGAGVFVAERDGSVLGVVSYAPATHAAFGDRTEIKHLYVSSDTQGQGIGRALLQAVFDQLDSPRAQSVALAAVEQNSAARAFYRQQGGVEVGRFIDPGPLWRSENIVVAWDA